MSITVKLNQLMVKLPREFALPEVARGYYQDWLKSREVDAGYYVALKCIRKKLELQQLVFAAEPLALKKFGGTKKNPLTADEKVQVTDWLNRNGYDLSRLKTLVKSGNQKQVFIAEFEADWRELHDDRLVFLYFYQEFLQAETEFHLEIRQQLVDLNKKQFKKFIYRMQKLILVCTNELVWMSQNKQKFNIPENDHPYSFDALCGAVYNRFEHLLVFLEKNYSEFLDWDQVMPVTRLSSRVNKLMKRADYLKTILIIKKLPEDLVNLLQLPLIRMTGISAQNRLTYREVYFIECYVNQLMTFLRKRTKQQIEVLDVFGLFIQVNYNLDGVYVFLSKYVRELLDTFSTEKDRLTSLYRWLKLVRLLIVVPDMYYTKGNISLQQFCLCWIEEEINFILKTTSLSDEKKLPVLKPDKINLNLTVGESALLLRIFKEVELSKASTKALTEHFSHNFRTVKQEEISTKSLVNKFYNPDPVSIDNLRSKIIEMLNTINRIQHEGE